MDQIIWWKWVSNLHVPSEKGFDCYFLVLFQRREMTLLFIVATITVPMTIWQRLSAPSRKEGVAKGTWGLCFYHLCGGAWKSKHAILHVVIWFADILLSKINNKVMLSFLGRKSLKCHQDAIHFAFSLYTKNLCLSLTNQLHIQKTLKRKLSEKSLIGFFHKIQVKIHLTL